MLNLQDWHPRKFTAALRAIDREAANSNTRIDFRTPAIVLLTMALSLLLIHYIKYASVFQQTLYWFSQWHSGNNNLFNSISSDQWFSLYAQAWWTAWHLVGYVLIPWCVIHWTLKQRLRDFGLGFGQTRRYIPYCIGLATPIVLFAFIASFREDFANHYPFYRLASRSVVDLVLWEILYIAQFIALEFFFRGFVLHACKPMFGAGAIFIMCVPYLMIHFSKPWLEAAGAIPFGILLGVLALRSRSIWGGAGVHVSVALCMDLTALMQSGDLPVRWLP